MPTLSDRIQRYVLKPEEADQIVDALARDLASRGMIGDVWFREVLAQEKEEIKGAWAKIIRRMTNKFGRQAQEPRKRQKRFSKRKNEKR